jgi:hypothetical protein
MGIGTLAYQRRPAPPGLPVRLGPRPAVLAGREEFLAELDARLTNSGEQQGPQIVALSGLGGAGKTSAAAEYAHRHIAEVAVCWQFAAEDPTVLGAEFAELAAQLGAREPVDVRDPVASVHSVLARYEADWLLVFDNVTDQASVERFLPPAGHGRILITTQNQHWPPSQLLNVPSLDMGVAAGFLVSRTGNADLASARSLARELGGLPLALEQAAAYMQASGTSPGQYLELFRTRRAELLARGKAAGHPADVAATLSLAVSRLACDSPDALVLLRLLAFLAAEPAPVRELINSGESQDPAITGTVGALAGDPLAVADAITALRRYSLVASTGDGLLLVHRLVQAITRDQLTDQQASQWHQTAAVLVEAAVPADAKLPAAWPECAMLLPHAQAVLDLTSAGIWRIAQSLGYGGSYLAARDLFRQIIAAYQEASDYGPEHRDTLTALYSLAGWTGETGDVTGARDQCAELLPIIERVLGPDHPGTLATRNNLAHWTGQAGDAAGARNQYAELLPIFERVLGPDHPDTLATRNNLADWTGQAGDAAGARNQYAELLPVRERVLGLDHPKTLATRSSLARWIAQAQG